mgnify:CR=1 FL=1
MTTHEQNAKSDRQTRPEPAHNSHKSKTNDTPRPPRVRPRGQERERKKRSIWYYVVQFSSGPSSAFLCPHTQRSGISPRTGRFNMCVERSSATQGGPAFSEWACCGVGSRLRAWLQPRAVVYNRRAGWPWITEGSGRGTWRAWCTPVAPVGVKVCGCAVCARRMRVWRALRAVSGRCRRHVTHPGVGCVEHLLFIKSIFVCYTWKRRRRAMQHELHEHLHPWIPSRTRGFRLCQKTSLSVGRSLQRPFESLEARSTD